MQRTRSRWMWISTQRHPGTEFSKRRRWITSTGTPMSGGLQSHSLRDWEVSFNRSNQCRKEPRLHLPTWKLHWVRRLQWDQRHHQAEGRRRGNERVRGKAPTKRRSLRQNKTWKIVSQTEHTQRSGEGFSTARQKGGKFATRGQREPLRMRVRSPVRQIAHTVARFVWGRTRTESARKNLQKERGKETRNRKQPPLCNPKQLAYPVR